VNNKNCLKQLWIAAALVLVMFLQSTNVFAGEKRGGWSNPLPSRHEVIVVRGKKYHYNEGRFYRPWFFGFGFTVAIPPIGAIVNILPFGHRTIIVAGATYYCYDDVYYMLCPSGYVVVPAPIVSQQVIATQNLTGEKIPISIPNSNGSYTTIILVKQGDGYVGPQGEYYPGNPTMGQLKSLYGK